MRLAGRGRWGWVIFGASLLGFIPGMALRAEERLDRFEFLQIRMGIPVTIVVYAPDRSTANEATNAAYSRIKEIDRSMSDYDPDSELMQLCASSRPSQAVPVGEDLWTVLLQSQTLWKESEGAFDVSVGPVVKLWRTARRKKVLPQQEAIDAARDRIGFQHVILDPERRTVSFAKSGMQLDLGAIAKGYAADAAIKTLHQRGITRALVEAGGDITVADPPPGQPGWRIELERLTPDRQGKPVVLVLANAAVATSGDTYQFVEIDGIRYSHLIDPKTGLGLTTPGSVTVIARDGTLADGLASAVSVLGPDRGLELAKRFQAETYVMQLTADGTIQATSSPGFMQYQAN